MCVDLFKLPDSLPFTLLYKLWRCKAPLVESMGLLTSIMTPIRIEMLINKNDSKKCAEGLITRGRLLKGDAY